jgi:antitoxin component YwqK of YwqJK toxin-antitoxin module
MKRILFIPLSLIIWACGPSDKESQALIVVPNKSVNAAEVLLEKKGPQLFVDGLPYSGYLIEYDKAEKVSSTTGYFAGLKEGRSEAFYESGVKKEQRFYINNRKDGNHQGWWANGSLKYDISFENGLTEGESLEWYEDGTPYKAFHYLNGQEIGAQKMWERDGGIRANYVVKNGHRYGLIGLKNCKSVENEEGSLTALAY